MTNTQKEVSVLKAQIADLQGALRTYVQRDADNVLTIHRLNRSLVELQAEHAAKEQEEAGKPDAA